MPDLFDTSRLRDAPAHWDALAERVAATAARESARGGLVWFADSRAGWIAASLLLAAALAFTVLPAEDSGRGSLSLEWVQALAPADDIGKAIISADSPPAIGALLLDGRDRVAR
jgi:hypothetical protein